MSERPRAGDPRLPAHLARYRDERPSRSRRKSLGTDGSALELEIVSFLVRGGLTDEEIAEYFDDNEFPRYVEEKRSQTWLGSLIATARENQERFLSSQTRTATPDKTHNTQDRLRAVWPAWERAARRSHAGRAHPTPATRKWPLQAPGVSQNTTRTKAPNKVRIAGRIRARRYHGSGRRAKEVAVPCCAGEGSCS